MTIDCMHNDSIYLSLYSNDPLLSCCTQESCRHGALTDAAQNVPPVPYTVDGGVHRIGVYATLFTLLITLN